MQKIEMSGQNAQRLEAVRGGEGFVALNLYSQGKVRGTSQLSKCPHRLLGVIHYALSGWGHLNEPRRFDEEEFKGDIVTTTEFAFELTIGVKDRWDEKITVQPTRIDLKVLADWLEQLPQETW